MNYNLTHISTHCFAVLKTDVAAHQADLLAFMSEIGSAGMVFRSPVTCCSPAGLCVQSHLRDSQLLRYVALLSMEMMQPERPWQKLQA